MTHFDASIQPLCGACTGMEALQTLQQEDEVPINTENFQTYHTCTRQDPGCTSSISSEPDMAVVDAKKASNVLTISSNSCNISYMPGSFPPAP